MEDSNNTDMAVVEEDKGNTAQEWDDERLRLLLQTRRCLVLTTVLDWYATSSLLLLPPLLPPALAINIGSEMVPKTQESADFGFDVSLRRHRDSLA